MRPLSGLVRRGLSGNVFVPDCFTAEWKMHSSCCFSWQMSHSVLVWRGVINQESRGKSNYVQARDNRALLSVLHSHKGGGDAIYMRR